MKTIELCQKDPIPFKENDLYKHSEHYTFYSIPSPNNINIKTEGYLNYLAKAWSNHCSIILNPTDIWYMILCELAVIIKKNPTDYAYLFTKTPDKKQLILVQTNNVETIDPELLINELKHLLPSNINSFLPRFSTDTQLSTLAMNVAFCDVVSPFYNYATFLCGIPNITIGGTIEDWTLIKNNLNELYKLFRGKMALYTQRCHNQVCEIINNTMTKNETKFFKEIVSLKPCGSGHQFELTGWICNFLYDNKSTQLEGLPSHTSQMTYKNMETQREFNLKAGIFHSYIKDGFLIPEYNAYRYELIKETKADKQKNDRKDALSMILTQSPIQSNTKKTNKKLIIKFDKDIEYFTSINKDWDLKG